MCCSFQAWLRYGVNPAYCRDAWLMNLLLNVYRSKEQLKKLTRTSSGTNPRRRRENSRMGPRCLMENSSKVLFARGTCGLHSFILLDEACRILLIAFALPLPLPLPLPLHLGLLYCMLYLISHSPSTRQCDQLQKERGNETHSP